jgi:PAS domain S-box-containing protein
MSVHGRGPTTVLHVDDDPDFADLVAVALEREDDAFEVLTETSVEAGMDRLAAADVDCVVSDYQMPGTDGLTFLEAVRADRPDLPFVLFTGKGSEEVASEAISAGVTDYLQKDGGTDQFVVLANRIRNAVARYEAERQAEQAFHAVETAREGISLLDEAGYFTYVNDEFCATVGYDRETLIGAHWELLYPDEDVDRVYAEILPSIPTEGRWTGQTTYVRGDGEHVLVDHALSVCESGGMICVIKQLSDDDADRQHDGPLVAEDAFVECVLDALEDVFCVVDTDGRIVRVNERAVEVTGHDRATLTGMHATDVVVPDDRARVERAIDETLATGRATGEVDVETAAGFERPYEFRARRLTDATGRTIGLVGLGRDVAERARIERRLQRQTEQFESFGSVLAHDLKTPLNTVAGRLDLARETHDDEHFAAARRALDRLETLVEDLANVMKQGQLVDEPTTVDLAATVRACWDLLDPAEATLEVDDAGSIRADEEALTRLLENLLDNVIDHAGAGVTVRVGTLPDGFYVEDDGVGIPEADREAIFEPGFSTSAGGTGFGLVSVRQIALAHGWAVTVTESGAGGARFAFTDVERP